MKVFKILSLKRFQLLCHSVHFELDVVDLAHEEINVLLHLIESPVIVV